MLGKLTGPGLAGAALVLLATANAAVSPAEPAAPRGLTAWRTVQGIMLAWSKTPVGGNAVWRGEEGEALELLAVLPAGQAGFLDLSAARTRGYTYALGSQREPEEAESVSVSALPGKGGLTAGLVTTCSGLARDRRYPADTKNYFDPGKDRHVQFYGYFLIRPYDPAPRPVRLVWRDPEGKVFSEFSHSVVPQAVKLPTGIVGQVLLMQAIGLSEVLPENGQTRVPSEKGLYLVEAYVEEDLAATTVFYLTGASGSAAPR